MADDVRMTSAAVCLRVRRVRVGNWRVEESLGKPLARGGACNIR